MVWLAALIIGIIDAIVLYLFELVGVEGTVWLWDDILHTNTTRWLVFPVAVVLGLVLTAAYKLVKTPRVKETSGDLLEELTNPPSTLRAIGVVLFIGAISLLAGASLGPEAALMAFSAGLGGYMASKMKVGSSKQLLVLASVGALLVAFVRSILLVLLPLLMYVQQSRKHKTKIEVKALVLLIIPGITSLITILTIHKFTNTTGIGLIPALPSYGMQDYWVAILIGFIAGGIALLLNQLIKGLSRTSLEVSKLKFFGSDWVFGAMAGLALGMLYYAGGPTVEFSGKVGSDLLVQHATQFTAVMLASFVVIKLVATAWSAGTGYRGGLVFPSIYMGIAMGLLFTQLFPDFGGTGAIIGAISGMMTAVVGSAAIAGIFLIAALPVNLWPLGICAIIGTTIFTFFIKRFFKKKPA